MEQTAERLLMGGGRGRGGRGGGGGEEGDENRRRCMAKCTMQSRLQRYWMILRKTFCNLASGQLRAWKISFEGSPHRCRHGLDPHRIRVFCLHVVTEHRDARCQMHHPRPFLLISAPLRAALSAEVFSSKPGNMRGLVRHMSFQTFHHRKLLSILKQLFLSELLKVQFI